MKPLLIPITLILILIFTSCQDYNDVTVTYRASKASSPYSLTYVNETGNLIKQEVPSASEEDQWEYHFEARQGDIVYLSGKYGDISSGLSLMILIDGKTYKQASSQHDTVKYLIVSGTVPY